MTEETAKVESRSWIGIAALILISVGWIVSVLLGGRFELHRSAVAMPLIVAGGLLGLVEAFRSGRAVRTPALVAGVVAMLYFALRAIDSPVWDLGRHDLHLIALVWLTIATVASCAMGPREVSTLVVVAILVFAAQLAAGVYQRFGDAEFVFFHIPRHSGAGVSGLFWQWNHLAGLLAILLPFLLGIAFTSRRWAMRGMFLGLVLTGVWLAYLTKSRAGFFAVMAGLGCVGVVFLLWKAQTWSFSARVAAWSGLLLVGIAAAIGMMMVVSSISEDRGQGADIENALGKGSRLGLAGLAFDLWKEEPVFGNGSQSFRYLAVQNWDYQSLGGSMGNPETVHNEYLQVLTDYGLVGFLLVMTFLVVVLLCALIPPREENDPPGAVTRGLRMGAAGGLLGAMVHATIDFQTHLLPIILLAGIAIGLLVKGAGRAGMLPRGVHLLAVLIAAGFAVISVGRESLATASWLRWERNVVARGGKITVERLPDLKKLVEASPHYAAARMYGRLHYSSFLQSGDASLLDEAGWGLALAFERNPKDPLTLVNYALVLDQMGRFDDAVPIHLEAMKMAGARENKYGALGGVSQHLGQRGLALWMKRESEEALACFLLAQEYLELSLSRRFKFGGRADYAERRRWLEDKITRLQAGRIKPQVPEEIKPLVRSQSD